MNISRIGRVITIWDELLFKIRVYLNVQVIRKKVFLESSHYIETYLDVLVGVLEVQSNVSFEFFLDEEFTEFWF